MGNSRFWLALLVSVLVSGCTWVELTDDGAAVRVSGNVSGNCELRGTTTSVSRAAVAGIDRNQQKFESELEILARNQAAILRGNVIVPAGPVEDNQRTYRVFRCS